MPDPPPASPPREVPDPFESLDPQDGATAARIHRVFQRSYRREAELVGVEDFPPLHRTTEDIVASRTRFFGASEEGRLAVVIEVQVSAEQLEICSLVVDPAFFRRGLGRRAVRFVLARFPRPTTLVETAVANEPALALYRRHGFVEETRWHTPGGIHKVRLRLLRPVHGEG